MSKFIQSKQKLNKAGTEQKSRPKYPQGNNLHIMVFTCCKQVTAWNKEENKHGLHIAHPQPVTTLVC